MANFYVSGVYKNADGIITHLVVHAEITEDPANNTFWFGKGVKMTEKEVIALRNAGNVLQVILWNFSDQLWNAKAEINVIGADYNAYLRSTPDKSLADNLDNLLTGTAFI